MRLHILDSTGDTILAVTDSTITEAEKIIQRHWDSGSSLFTKEGNRLGTMDDVREAAKAPEAEAYMVPRLAGG